MLGIARELRTALWLADALSELGQDLAAAGEIADGARHLVEAIQTASRCEANPVSAVTRPPVPRLTDPSSSNVTGPRLETRTSGAEPEGVRSPAPPRR